MNRLISIVFFALTLPLFSVAQSNYKPGYVVTLKGDSVKGFINYKEWDQNPSSIDFKTNISDKAAQNLTIADIKLFNIIGFESYQKYTGLIGTDYIDPDHINYGKDTSFRVASVFLKVLAEGKYVTLLSYADDIRPHFYIEETPAYAPKELIYHIYKENDSQTDAIKTKIDNEYVTQLYFLAQKYNVMTSDVQMDLEHMSYNADLITIVNKINGTSQTGTTADGGRNSKISFFAGVGVNVTTTVPDSYDFAPLGATNHTSELPLITAGFNLPINANIEKVILRCELSIGGIHYYTNYIDKVAPYVPIIYKYSAIGVAFIPQIIYNFYNADNLKIFGGIGFSLSYYNYMNASYAQRNGTPVPNNSAYPYYFVNFSTPIVIKGGIRLHRKFEIYADYVTGSPVSNDEVFKLSFASFQMGLNYFFK